MPNIVTYVSFVDRVPGSEFRARFPDFPGIRASDATVEDVARRAARALRAHIDQLIQVNEGVPQPMSIEEVKDDGRYREGFLLKIDIEVPEPSLYTRGRRGSGS